MTDESCMQLATLNSLVPYVDANDKFKESRSRSQVEKLESELNELKLDVSAMTDAIDTMDQQIRNALQNEYDSFLRIRARVIDMEQELLAEEQAENPQEFEEAYRLQDEAMLNDGDEEEDSEENTKAREETAKREAEIKEMYRFVSKHCHPDRCHNNKDKVELFIRAKEAYEQMDYGALLDVVQIVEGVVRSGSVIMARLMRRLTMLQEMIAQTKKVKNELLESDSFQQAKKFLSSNQFKEETVFVARGRMLQATSNLSQQLEAMLRYKAEKAMKKHEDEQRKAFEERWGTGSYDEMKRVTSKWGIPMSGIDNGVDPS